MLGFLNGAGRLGYLLAYALHVLLYVNLVLVYHLVTRKVRQQP